MDDHGYAISIAPAPDFDVEKTIQQGLKAYICCLHRMMVMTL